MSRLKRTMADHHWNRLQARRHHHIYEKLNKHIHKFMHWMSYVGNKPGEGTNVGCGLISQSVTLNYKEFMEGGTNAD